MRDGSTCTPSYAKRNAERAAQNGSPGEVGARVKTLSSEKKNAAFSGSRAILAQARATLFCARARPVLKERDKES